MMNEGDISAKHVSTGEPVRLHWKNGVITSLNPISSAPENVWIAPTLFDLQINGYGGVDFQQDDLTGDDLLSATRQLRRDGCSRFFLTLITEKWPTLTARLRHARKLRSQSAELQNAIAGWHIEGPFLSGKPGFHGAHDPTSMCDPDLARIRELREIVENDPLLLTLAPERPGSIEAIKLAKSLHITVSLGHTDASAETLRRAVEAGAGGFTHLGNGCPSDLNRHDNILWRVFETPGLTVSLIHDHIHLSPALFRLAHRILEGNIYYTTDAMSAAGAPPGIYKLSRMELEVGSDQIVRQPGKTNFAGSALKPIDGIFRAAGMLNQPWQEAWDRASRTPAKLVGLMNELKVGQPADFCVVKFADSSFAELKSYACGQEYKAPA